MNEIIPELKKDIIAIGRVLWEKELATGLNGNISARVDEKHIVLTATKTCLGLLQENEILLTDLEGQVIGEGQVSTERLLHTEIYKNFPDAQAVIHTHTTYTNAYFLENDSLEPRIFESKFYLGEVEAVPQVTPSVTDAGPVVAALKKNNIVVLKNHGVVAMGKDLFDCFLLIQCLEDAVKIDVISRLYQKTHGGKSHAVSSPKTVKSKNVSTKKYKLFSTEQIDEIVKIVNDDSKMQELGRQTAMNMDLAVKLDETGDVFSFRFENGRIVNVGREDGVEFVISAPETIWRAVFNREIDPFVATTQKKMNLHGDFGKISKWYAPCSRIFELWTKVPVE
ncbi:MAG: class II aldolase/adducin family protein [Candidatus Omnitrophica bacterium]|nr:class II aldolase/adducin family protein [Candidatus Omnitrophota bacterium]